MGRARVKHEETPQVPGMEDKRNERVHAAAVRYWERMQARKAAGDEEVAAKESLVRVMQEANLTSYKFGDVEVHLDVKTLPKVTRQAPGGEDDDGE